MTRTPDLPTGGPPRRDVGRTALLVAPVVLFARDPKDVSQIALEDTVTAPVQPAALLTTNTPASHISIERMAKPHVVLARCPDADQSGVEPLFAQASEVMATYRHVTGAREIVPAEIDRLSLGVGPGYRAPKVKPMKIK